MKDLRFHSICMNFAILAVFMLTTFYVTEGER